MIPDAKWTECDAPDNLDGLVRLPPLWDDEAEILVHRSGHYVLRRMPIGGGWRWEVARLERREGERRANPRGLGYWQREGYDGGPRPDDTRKVLVTGGPFPEAFDRRDPDRALETFLELHGNGEAAR